MGRTRRWIQRVCNLEHLSSIRQVIEKFVFVRKSDCDPSKSQMPLISRLNKV